MIEIVPCGGNTGSLTRCLERLGAAYRISERPESGVPLIIPGVGSFGGVMAELRSRDLVEWLRGEAAAGTPVLGICVGMQILFDRSEEAGATPGLGLIPGRVVRFARGKVPQVGWNRVEPARGRGGGGYAYFVNSYHAVPESDEDCTYTADYYGAFCAAAARRSATGYQFHPEKSGEFGLELLKEWLLCCANE
ncbi:imidazole glycerol phosphate synthase subunit HisH [Candidatus Fermentibacteria bacterium]|nr:imidazole glycerol phosphate synthase subunit HisH [Candidatus Fermentibacteria bacterium]